MDSAAEEDNPEPIGISDFTTALNPDILSFNAGCRY